MDTWYNSKEGDSTIVRVCTILVCVAVLCTLLLAPHAVRAETSLSLTVTPPLVQLSLDPGATWQSTVRVVNGNPYPLTIYPDPVVFQPTGQEGKGEFIPSLEGEKPDYTLAGWMEVPQEGVTIGPEKTIELPVRISIPEDAAPGGHYAALLIGNRAPSEGSGDGTVSVTSAIATLFFLNVSGDVLERGRIRDFSSDKAFYQEPNAQFNLRFENLGTVHLQPRGDITIYNMWGKRRGYLPVNQETTDWGNVLPDSMRRFSSVWSGDIGLYDIGRYRAEATLGYGNSAVRYAEATTYFWIVPVVEVAKVVGTGVVLILVFAWTIRAYVRRALALEAARLGGVTVPGATEDQVSPVRNAPSPQLSVQTLMRPLQEGIIDLRARDRVTEDAATQNKNIETPPVEKKRYGCLDKPLLRYVLPFLGFAVLVGVTIVAVSAYFEDVLTYERAYSVEVKEE